MVGRQRFYQLYYSHRLNISIYLIRIIFSLGAQMKTMHNLRLMVGDVLDLCRLKAAAGGYVLHHSSDLCHSGKRGAVSDILRIVISLIGTTLYYTSFS